VSSVCVLLLCAGAAIIDLLLCKSIFRSPSRESTAPSSVRISPSVTTTEVDDAAWWQESLAGLSYR
jgi:hypothetical protein